MAMASPQSTPSITFRQNVTLTRPESLPGRVVEYPIVTPRTVQNLPSARPTSKDMSPRNPTITRDIYSKDSVFTPRQSLLRDTLNKYAPLKNIRSTDSATKDISAGDIPKDDSEFQLRQKPWAVSGPSGQAINASIRKKRLESVNLKGSRKASRSSGIGTQNGTSSSCRRSDSTTNDSQKSVLTTESVEALQHTTETIVGEKRSDSIDNKDEEVTEEEMEKRRNIEKCMNWIDNLPEKFSGMYIVQERVSTSGY